MTLFIEYTKNKNFVKISKIYSLLIEKAPRAGSKKVRKYEHIDLTKDFEIRHKKREKEKM